MELLVFWYVYSCFIIISATNNSLSYIFQYLCYSKTYFYQNIQLNLNNLIFKDFFEWADFSDSVEKWSYITICNRMVLYFPKHLPIIPIFA